MEVETIFGEIKKEREAQDKKWGGPANDDENEANDWVAFITRHLGKSIDPYMLGESGKISFRNQMIRVAALAVAAIEATDRRLNHC